MIIVIDAYNVLKQWNTGVISERQRSSFLRELSLYAQCKGHTIIAIFDGGDYDRAAKFNVYGIEVIYSGQRLTADDVIQDLLKELSGYQVILVSSDRALEKEAGRRNILTLEAVEFYMFVRCFLEASARRLDCNNQELKKRVDCNSSQELDDLMKQVSCDSTKDARKEDPLPRVRSRKLSKSERYKAQLIKKL
jgi:predicted RNA-binding protein with PIN domain